MKKDILTIFNKYSKFQVRKLGLENVNQIYLLEKTQPMFFKELHEKLTQKSVAESLSDTPPNKTLNDKHFLGFYDHDDNLVAVLDVVEKYPDNDTAFIGLFMVDNQFCGQGIGSSIVKEILYVIKELNLKKIRLGYVQSNNQSKFFWLSKCGFEDIDEIHEHERYVIQICEKNL